MSTDDKYSLENMKISPLPVGSDRINAALSLESSIVANDPRLKTAISTVAFDLESGKTEITIERPGRKRKSLASPQDVAPTD